MVHKKSYWTITTLKCQAWVIICHLDSLVGVEAPALMILKGFIGRIIWRRLSYFQSKKKITQLLLCFRSSFEKRDLNELFLVFWSRPTNWRRISADWSLKVIFCWFEKKLSTKKTRMARSRSFLLAILLLAVATQHASGKNSSLGIRR